MYELPRMHSRMWCERAILPWVACISVLAGAVLFACQADSRTDPLGAVDLESIDLRYDCGNNFELSNGNSIAVTVEFEVAGTGESGELTLAASAAGQASRTRLTTVRTGEVVIGYQRQRITQQPNAGVACPPPSEPRATTGEWTAPFPWPLVAVHLQLLPTERVLSWGRSSGGGPVLWDPEIGGFTALPVASDL